MVVRDWSSSLFDNFLDKLSSCSKETNDWGTSIKRDFHDKVDACRKDLENTHFSNNAQDVALFLELKSKLATLVTQE